MNEDQKAWLIELARKKCLTDDISVDNDANFSVGKDGTWVEAWVYISNEEIPK